MNTISALGRMTAVSTVVVLMVAEASVAPAFADNRRLNAGVFSNIYAAQKMNGCSAEPRLDERLIAAAQRHTIDVRDHWETNGDIGSDGSSAQQRANEAGFIGKVSETVAINPALAINNLDILNQWWNDPPSRVTMQDCSNTAIGVWTENSLTRSVAVAVYGQPGVTDPPA